MALRFYKHGQGKLSRGVAALTIGLIGAFGCYRLFLWLGGYRFFRNVPELLEGVLGTDIELNLALLISTGSLVILAVGIYVLSNRPRIADFLMDTEAELNKVSWPTRKEVVGSSIVIIVVVSLLGLYIAVIDVVLARIRDGWGALVDLIFGK